MHRRRCMRLSGSWRISRNGSFIFQSTFTVFLRRLPCHMVQRSVRKWIHESGCYYIGIGLKGAHFYITFRDLSPDIKWHLASHGRKSISERLTERSESGRTETIKLEVKSANIFPTWTLAWRFVSSTRWTSARTPLKIASQNSRSASSNPSEVQNASPVNLQIKSWILQNPMPKGRLDESVQSTILDTSTPTILPS